MTKKYLPLLGLLALLLVACPEKGEQTAHPKKPLVTVGDRSDNGGWLRLTLEGKTMHDRFVVAQFTPRGDLFQADNLQIYTYDIDSDKYPRFLLSLSLRESDLRLWQAQQFPMDTLAFTVAPELKPLSSRGEIRITRVSDQFVEGQFAGELFSPENGKSLPIRGEFKAVLRWNV